MRRLKRAEEAGVVCHAINRRNARQPNFLKHEDLDAFLRVLAEGLGKYPVESFGSSAELVGELRQFFEDC